MLADAGLVCGANPVHVGQGTANAVYCFDNAYLELLWMHDERELDLTLVAPLRLSERVQWRSTGACPFGVALRPGGDDESEQIVTWSYAAPYLPAGASIPMVSAKGAGNEPLVFVMPWGGAPSTYPAERAVPLEQKGRRRVLRHVKVELPEDAVSPAVRRAQASGVFSIAAGSTYHMRLELAANGPEEVIDFRPQLPLSIEW
jgi:hypothetical protein